MSKAKLRTAIGDIKQLDEIRARHIDSLRVAAGSGVDGDEKALVDEFVADKFPALTDKAQRRVVSKFVTTLPNAAKLEARKQHKLDVEEASGIAPLTGGRALVVDDAKGVYFVDGEGDSSLLLSAKKYPGLNDLEGVATNEAETDGFVVSEASRTVYHFAIKDGADLDTGKPVALGTLPELNDGACNGWEGLEVVPGRFLRPPNAPADQPDPPDALVCVHEAAPTRVAFVEIPEEPLGDKPLKVIREFKIPKQAAPHLLDISDITVDPKNGHLFLLSDRSQTIVELEPRVTTQAQQGGLLEHTMLQLIGVTPIEDGQGTKPEGIGFDPDNGQLVVASEKGRKGRIQRFDVNRPS